MTSTTTGRRGLRLDQPGFLSVFPSVSPKESRAQCLAVAAHHRALCAAVLQRGEEDVGVLLGEPFGAPTSISTARKRSLRRRSWAPETGLDSGASPGLAAIVFTMRPAVGRGSSPTQPTRNA